MHVGPLLLQAAVYKLGFIAQLYMKTTKGKVPGAAASAASSVTPSDASTVAVSSSD